MARYGKYGANDDQYVEEVDSNFIGFNDRSRPDALKQGMFVSSNNFRFDLGGVAEPRKAITNVSTPFTEDTAAITLPFYLYASDVASSISVGTNKITLSGVTTDSNSAPTNASGIVNNTVVSVSGITGLSANYIDGGNFVATRVDATTIDIAVTGVSGSPGGTATVGAPKLEAGRNAEIKGSCNFVDATNEDEEYILLASNAKSVAVKVSDGTTSDIGYPDGRLIEKSASMIQAFDKVFLFERGRTPLQWDLNFSNDFTFFSSGSFTQPQLISTENDCSISNGLVTVEDTNTFSVGDEISIVDKGGTDLTNGTTFRIASATSSIFTFFAEATDIGSSGAGSGVAIKLIGLVSGGAGFTHCPAPAFGIVHDNRLVVPYEFDVSSAANTYTVRDPAVTDEVLISNGFNQNKFDIGNGTFVTADGSNDSIIALFSFAEGKLVVFHRKMISVITGTTSFKFSEGVTTVITKELGCVARNSIVQVGNQLIFLSDNGIYGASFQDLYNLRGNEIPLSEPINKTIESINRNGWENSTAVYYNNRYYIAVPVGATQIENNTILIYNFLNKAWESVDTCSDSNWSIQRLIVAGRGESRGVYAINSLGGVHRIDSSIGETDLLVTTLGTTTPTAFPIASSLKTRQFNAGSIDRKKWNQFEIVMDSSTSSESQLGITANFENTDATATLTTVVAPGDEGVSSRGRIGNHRAYGLQFDLVVNGGTPQIKIIKATGGFAFKSIESTQ